MRRVAVVVGLAAGLLLLGAGTAVADDTLAGYQEEAGAARYSGRQVVVAFSGGSSAVDVGEVAHFGGMTKVSTASGSTVVSAGRVSGGGDVEVAGWSPARLATRYEVGTPVSVERLGRPADSVDVMEMGRLRARFVFDRATGAPLMSEVYAGDGSLYRLSALVSFSTTLPADLAVPEEMGSDVDMLLPTDPGELPAEAGGYLLMDVYAGPEGAIHAYYADGLFSFSLFQFGGEAEMAGMEHAADLVVERATYRRMLTASDLWVEWFDGTATFLLVGDLPPDHLDRVLPDLPRPWRPGFFDRLWRSLFG